MSKLVIETKSQVDTGEWVPFQTVDVVSKRDATGALVEVLVFRGVPNDVATTAVKQWVGDGASEVTATIEGTETRARFVA